MFPDVIFYSDLSITRCPGYHKHYYPHNGVGKPYCGVSVFLMGTATMAGMTLFQFKKENTMTAQRQRYAFNTMIEDMIDAGDTSRIEELTNPDHIDINTLNPDEFIVGNVEFSLDYEDPFCFLTIEFDVSINNDNDNGNGNGNGKKNGRFHMRVKGHEINDLFSEYWMI